MFAASSISRRADGLALFSYRPRGNDQWLEWKVRIFTVAAALTLGGIYLDERWLTGTAIAVLAGGLALRFLPGPNEPGADELEAAGSLDSEDDDS